jgi:hypothetical protein
MTPDLFYSYLFHIDVVDAQLTKGKRCKVRHKIATVLTSQGTRSTSVTKVGRLMLLKRVRAVRCENNRNHANRLRNQSAQS